MTLRRRCSCLATALLLAPLSGACYAYVQTGAPNVLLAPGSVQEIHLGRKDGRVVVLRNPTLARDTIWGRLAANAQGDSTGVALKDVEWAMARGYRASPRATIAGGSILLLTGFWIYAASRGF